MLQARKVAVREDLNFEEQLHVLDQVINSSPVFSNLNPDKHGVALATAPNFSHATSYANVSKENLDLIGDEVRYDVDCLEAIWVEEFKMGWTSIPKEKKGAHGRPRKSSKGDLFYTENTSPLSPNSSYLATHIPKRTLKRIGDKKLNCTEKKVAGPDLGEK